jgi:hypothetical protein
MRFTKTIAPLTIAAALAVAAPAAAAPTSAAQLREFEGTVVSVNRDNKTFRLHDTERGTVRIRVTSRTRFERIAGFSGLKAGMKRIESTVRRSNGAWVASEVERSGGGGQHGGDDDDDRRGGDDDRGRGRGSDDHGDDDSGHGRGRGRGSDDD